MSRNENKNLKDVNILLSEENRDYIEECLSKMKTNEARKFSFCHGNLMVIFTLYVLMKKPNEEIIKICKNDIEKLRKKTFIPERENKKKQSTNNNKKHITKTNKAPSNKLKHLSISGKYITERERQAYHVKPLKFRIGKELNEIVEKYCNELTIEAPQYGYSKNISSTMFYISAITYCGNNKLPNLNCDTKMDICDKIGIKISALKDIFVYMPYDFWRLFTADEK